MKLTELLIAELDREVPRSRRALAEVPAGKYDWKPHDESMILGYWTHHRGQMTVCLRLLGARGAVDLWTVGGRSSADVGF